MSTSQATTPASPVGPADTLPPPLCIRLLGGFAVSRGGHVVNASAWRLRKAQSLVKLLALAPGHRLHRERAMELLWPDLDPEAAANNLRQAAHVARGALAQAWAPAPVPGPLLRLRQQILALDAPEPLWVDVEAFAAAAAAAHRADNNPGAYEAALALYGGELLPEDRYDDWAAGPREALQATYFALLLDLARLQGARGVPEVAVEALRRVLATEPAYEEAHVQLMRLYAGSGRRDQALRQYAELQEALRRELDIPPDPASRRLYEEILAGRYVPEPLPPGNTDATPAPHMPPPESSGAAAVTPAVATAARPPVERPPEPPRPPHNLPIQPAPLLGREAAVAGLAALLRRADARLATVTGPGGVGKTCLALQVAAELLEDFADGVWFVRLAPLTDPALVLPTVAETLGLRESGGQAIEQVLQQYVRDRRLLLLLDNFEHLLGAASEVAELLAASPDLKVLVTSRARMHLRGEQEVPVAPLELPDPRHLPALEQLSGYPAVALFIQRARAVKPDFQMTTTNAAAVAEICAHLDGLPLAIELAAARVRLLSPEALLARLSHRLSLLTGGPRDLEERQQTMRATLAWSEDLLAPEERVLFRRLAVFAGGCTLEAAEAVCATPEGAEPLGMDVFEGLGALADHSLLQQREEGGEPRFSLLHVIREYALERLAASDGGQEAEALRWAHVDYYQTFAERECEAYYAADDFDEPKAHTKWLVPEQDNLRTALAWLQAHADAARRTGASRHARVERAAIRRGVEAPVVRGMRLAGALVWPWAFRGHLAEGRAWLETFLALDTSALETDSDQAKRGRGVPSTARRRERTSAARAAGEAFVRGRALYAAGVLAHWQGDSAQALPSLERGLAIFQALGNQQFVCLALNNLGMAFQYQGDLARARACYEQSLALGRALSKGKLVVMPLCNLSILELAAGDLEQAAEYSEETLAIAREVHRRLEAAGSLIVQALIAWQYGQHSQAAALAKEALVLFRAVMDERYYADALEVYAIMCASQGRAEQAARLLGAAAACRERIGVRGRMATFEARFEAAVAHARVALGEEAWAATFAEGQTMALEEAIAEALGEAP